MQRDPYRIQDLHPKMSGPIAAMQVSLRTRVFETEGLKFVLQVFEGYRSPIRQNHLFSQVPKVTKARAWQSSHQYGLAVDFAGLRVDSRGLILTDKWVWPDGSHTCWNELKRIAAVQGLHVPISWDYGHVEHPVFDRLKTLLA